MTDSFSACGAEPPRFEGLTIRFPEAESDDLLREILRYMERPIIDCDCFPPNLLPSPIARHRSECPNA